jgi:hypothetical protein
MFLGLLEALAERLGAARDYMRLITAVHRDEIRLITVDEICYFQFDNKYTPVVTPGSRVADPPTHQRARG